MNINSRTSKVNFTGFASGAIASFTGLRVAPVDIKSYINSIQTGSGDPSPDNIRPIIGVSKCNVVRCGVNVWDEEWEYGSINNSDGTNITSSVRIRSKNYIEVKPNTSICVVNTNSVKIFIYKYAKDKSFLGMVDTSGLSSGNQVVNIPNDCYYLRFRSNDNYTYSNNVSINHPSTDRKYHAYTSNTYTIQLGDTYYGGSLDVTTGVLTVTHANIASYNGESINEPWICSEAVYSEVTTPPIGSQVVYPLATPVNIQLTPTQIEQFLGVNNVFADCGNVEVYYVTI